MQAAGYRALRFLPLVALVAFLVWFGRAQATADDRYWVQLGIEAMAVAVSVVGVNLLLGYTGLLSLGHFAFFVYGGFVGAVWAVQDWGLSPWFGFPIAFGTGMALGALLALTCCHLRGFYLTVVTLAFGLLASSLALVFDGLFDGLNGRAVEEPLDPTMPFLPDGLRDWLLGDATNPNRPYVGLYWIGAGLLLACLAGTWVLLRSRWGRAYTAIRESELAAAASGVPTYWTKVSAFALSAGMVSVAGVLTAQTQLQVTMVDGTAIVGESFELVIDAVVGGLGTLAGPIVGAFAFTLGLGVNFGSESLGDRLGEWETALLAALVIAVTILAPRGVVGSVQQALEPLLRHLRPPPPVAGPVATPHPAARAGTGREPALECIGVTQTFGALAALSDVDLRVTPGTVHALIGPNGSGKSTLVNVVTGIYTPDGGRVLVDGRETTGRAQHRCARAGAARTFQTCQIWRRMTVAENVMVGAHLHRPTRAEALALLRFVGLVARADDLAGSLPFADQRRLEIARALASHPAILILDEPAAGMHPGEVAELVELIRQIRASGVTVLLIEHHMEVVLELADLVTVLNFGRVIAEGPAEQIAQDPVVVEAYLGEHREAEPARAGTATSEPPAPTGIGEPERVPAVLTGAPGPASAADAPTPVAAGLAKPNGARPVLEVRGLHVRYGAAAALVGVDLEVREGEVVALIGANGAGKTTTLKTISGVAELLKSTHGEIWFDGARIDRWPAHRIARAGLTHVPEGRRVFPESSVEENLRLGAYRRRNADVVADLDAVYQRFPVLAQRRHQPAGLLSGGEQQMLAIGRALASQPRFLLLDEPSLGLAPIIVDEVFEIIGGLRREHVTILIVEQLATRALALADRAYILETGAVVRDGPARDLAHDPDVRAAYLGG